MSAEVKLFGIVNITEDSFSDGGRYLAPDAAISHASALVADGAEILDLGAASSNPDARPVTSQTEIARLGPVVAALKRDGRRISIDSFSTDVQRWALSQGVDYLNDIRGFPDPGIYPELAANTAGLVVMHSVQSGSASRISVPPEEIFDLVLRYFDERLRALAACNIGRERIILDPGMGYFLGSNPEASMTVLRRLRQLKSAFGLPVLVSVSRKSFLRTITGRGPERAGPASLVAELFTIRQGADYVRTHDPAALRDALKVSSLLDGHDSGA